MRATWGSASCWCIGDRDRRLRLAGRPSSTPSDARPPSTQAARSAHSRPHAGRSCSRLRHRRTAAQAPASTAHAHRRGSRRAAAAPRRCSEPADGHAASEFVTDADSGFCVLEQPWILVAERGRRLRPGGAAASCRRPPPPGARSSWSRPAIERGRAGDPRRSTPSADPGLRRRPHPEPDQRRGAVLAGRGDLLSRQDLQARVRAAVRFGTCGTWVSSGERLWILRD